jgi:hypothetical protein
MTILKGADSEIPQPGAEAGEDVWGIYLAGDVGHVWTKEELANLGRVGVRATIPIVIPAGAKPADGAWWFVEDEGAQMIVRLVAEARAWGLPGGAPLVFDLEENVVEAILAVDPSLPAKIEARINAACNAYGYDAWTYGGKAWHDAVGSGAKCHRWLAEWPTEVPTDPLLPAGFDAWQFAGNVDGGLIDRDIFAGGLKYLGADLVVAVIGEPEQAPAAPLEEQAPESVNASTSPAAEAATAEAAARVEEEKVAEAVVAEAPPAAAADAAELDKTIDAPPTPTHDAEAVDLVGKLYAISKAMHDSLATHLAELADLLSKESPK